MRPTLMVMLITSQTGRHVWDSFLEQGLFGQTICFVLLSISLVSWAITLKKFCEYQRMRRDEEKFTDIFRQLGGDFGTILDRSERCPNSCQAQVFREVYQELSTVGQLTGEELVMTKDVLRLVEQRGERAITECVSRVERHLSFLATATNVSPILGLFGTIWGLLGAFRSMGLAGNANVATVGTGVCEALVTTLIGLVAAIPAAYFFTFFRSKASQLATRLEVFMSELVSRLSRNALYHAHGEQKPAARVRRQRDGNLVGVGEG